MDSDVYQTDHQTLFDIVTLQVLYNKSQNERQIDLANNYLAIYGRKLQKGF